MTGYSRLAFRNASRLRLSASLLVALMLPNALAYEPIHVGFLWHMHQPIYYPYESPVQVDAVGRFSFSVVDVHNQRFGPYTTWPLDAVQAGVAMNHLGAQIISRRLTDFLRQLFDQYFETVAGINC